MSAGVEVNIWVAGGRGSSDLLNHSSTPLTSGKRARYRSPRSTPSALDRCRSWAPEPFGP